MKRIQFETVVLTVVGGITLSEYWNLANHSFRESTRATHLARAGAGSIYGPALVISASLAIWSLYYCRREEIPLLRLVALLLGLMTSSYCAIGISLLLTLGVHHSLFAVETVLGWSSGILLAMHLAMYRPAQIENQLDHYEITRA
jgi:hypothetical protein